VARAGRPRAGLLAGVTRAARWAAVSAALRGAASGWMSSFDAEAFVAGAVPGCQAVKFQKEQMMGFSGARVAEAICQLASGEETYFLKVIEPAPLPPTAPEEEKRIWDRNLKSYANEASFLRNDALQAAFRAHGVCLPKTLKVEAVEGQRYVFLAENLNQAYTSLAVHPASRTPEVLRWLAGFHGAFQGKVPSDHSLWEIGTHLHLNLRAAGELDNVPSSVANFCKAFSDVDPFFARAESAGLGARLQKVARRVADHLTPGPQNQRRTTLVHGDLKGANYFLKTEGEGCTAIDWQWTGPGIGATDLIYLFCGSVEDEVVDNYEQSLKIYHEALGVEGYDFEDLLTDFKVATLDYARWAFSVRLLGDTPDKFKKRAANVDVNLGYFRFTLPPPWPLNPAEALRRHPPRIRWLLQLVEAFLPEAESGALFSESRKRKTC